MRLETAAIGRFPEAARPLPAVIRPPAAPPPPLLVPWSRHRGLAERHAGTLAAPRPCLGVAALRQSAGAGRAKQLYGSAGGWPVLRAPCTALALLPDECLCF